ncbi:MAG: VIT1/CCC1 transporter family protein [Clostridiales bacterium]|nr:VIT1/CCC1 transporter family protein [Clostridiales bacterium]
MEPTDLSLIKEQRNEITSHLIYAKLAAKTRDGKNADVLRRMSEDELRHYNELKEITGREVKPSRFSIVFFYLISRLFGLTFGLKLLEKAEDDAVETYGAMVEKYPQLKNFVEDEQTHELLLIDMIGEEKLNYMGSVVLGLNDALVELTGALAGFTFAFQNTRMIAMTGLITGISASFSMAASEYLSTRQEKGEKSEAIKAAIYTGIAYVLTVAVLILPYLVFDNPFLCLGVSLFLAVAVIFVFNYYISVVKDAPFRRRFLEMAAISLGVAALSFLIGMLVKNIFGIEV